VVVVVVEVVVVEFVIVTPRLAKRFCNASKFIGETSHDACKMQESPHSACDHPVRWERPTSLQE